MRESAASEPINRHSQFTVSQTIAIFPHLSVMSPIAFTNVNGHTADAVDHSTNRNSPPHSSKSSILPAAEAMSFLDSYPRGDGLSLSELMDSRKNGGLTYNDFLMLPGHISFPASAVSLQTRYVHHLWGR